jgi:hypothetical protein
MKTNLTMMQILQNPRYRGKHIIIADGKLYTAKTGDGATEILKKVRKKNPNVIPEIAYLPKGKYITV